MNASLQQKAKDPLSRITFDNDRCGDFAVVEATQKAVRWASVLSSEALHYIVDFYCPAAQLVVEIDGGQHYTEQGRAQDSRRDAFLNDIGLRVLRFSNTDVLGNIDGVIAEIVRHLEKALAEGETKSP